MKISVFLFLLLAMAAGVPGVVAGETTTASSVQAQKKPDELQKKLEDLQRRVEKAEVARSETEGQLKTEIATRQKVEAQLALANKSSAPLTWDEWLREGLRQVLWPILRLLGIACILLFVVLKLELTSVLSEEKWSERAILALAIVITFCGAVLLNLPNGIPQELKEIVLLVLAFYFGASSKTEGKKPEEKKPEDKKPEERGGGVGVAGGV